MGTQKKQWSNDDVSLTISGTQLEKAVNYKYLGLLIDENVASHEQRTKTLNHVQSKLTLFSKIRLIFLTPKAAETVYKSMILPIIEYADYLYDQHIVYASNQLQL